MDIGRPDLVQDAIQRFICRGMLEKTKTHATAGSSHSKTRASKVDFAAKASNSRDVMT